MKCIKITTPLPNTPVGTIQRLKDKEADQKVDKGQAVYIPKSEWKAFKNNKSDE